MNVKGTVQALSTVTHLGVGVDASYVSHAPSCPWMSFFCVGVLISQLPREVAAWETEKRSWAWLRT